MHKREQSGVEAAAARRAFAEDHELPFAGGHILFPDVRIEFQTEDGILAYRDLEVAAEHYSRASVSAKQSAGFRVYRAAAGAGGSSRRGGAPIDPHHLQWLK